MRYRVIALSGFKSVQGETRFLLVRSEQSDEYCKLLYSTEYILLCAYKHPDEHLSISLTLTSRQKHLSLHMASPGFVRNE